MDILPYCLGLKQMPCHRLLKPHPRNSQSTMCWCEDLFEPQLYFTCCSDRTWVDFKMYYFQKLMILNDNVCSPLEPWQAQLWEINFIDFINNRLLVVCGSSRTPLYLKVIFWFFSTFDNKLDGLDVSYGCYTSKCFSPRPSWPSTTLYLFSNPAIFHHRLTWTQCHGMLRLSWVHSMRLGTPSYRLHHCGGPPIRVCRRAKATRAFKFIEVGGKCVNRHL